MAATSVSCGAVMLFRLDMNRVLRVTTLAAARKCSQNETWCRRWRSVSRRGLATTASSFSSSLEPSLKKEPKDKKTFADTPELAEWSERISLDLKDFKSKKHCRKYVSVIYHRGLPRVTVPLPSRREKCMFTLKPITHTVGDFLEMLKQEDKGIDRALITTIDGIRIASANSIESLMEEDFKLIVNDNVYTVTAPLHDRLTMEEAQRLSDVKVLVGQLYEALHVDEHQLQEEKQILTQLEDIKMQLQPLEDKRLELEATASRRTNLLTWAGLGLMSVQFGILARLTWWEYSWDIMEPVTYFVTYGTAMACYAYYVLTKQEYLLPDVRDRQHLLILHKKARKLGLDLNQYNVLKEQSSELETKLQRLRDPLKVRKTFVDIKREEREKYSSSSSRSPSSSPSPSPEREETKKKQFAETPKKISDVVREFSAKKPTR
ncbi:calcium uniporter protein, mitochondrial isoform X1 [Diprion similis]|uniref:calcium uniporter protein, mitochondrial isoform X1 n=1 Tax=Diprion similis TaxID=362088 RepID=UPI001EF9B435|nr:calcium uniporter protein, mitochondrial isoform X1 [Diprion similis]XP_046753278.1 calcium uniporter protein, mitochondrial isoform X1 [Diprion similis]